MNGAFLLREGAREDVETAPRNFACIAGERRFQECRDRSRDAHAASVERCLAGSYSSFFFQMASVAAAMRRAMVSLARCGAVPPATRRWKCSCNGLLR